MEHLFEGFDDGDTHAFLREKVRCLATDVTAADDDHVLSEIDGALIDCPDVIHRGQVYAGDIRREGLDPRATITASGL